MNPVCSDGGWRGNQHLQYKQMAGTLAEDFILLVLAGIAYVRTQRGYIRKEY